jgi:hypothetical protein
MNRITIAIIGLALTSPAMAQQTYKDAADAAYCVGVLDASKAELMSTETGRSLYGMNPGDVDIQRQRKAAFLTGAVHKLLIYPVDANQLMAVGRADQQNCSDNDYKACANAVNYEATMHCRAMIPSCRRVDACNE